VKVGHLDLAGPVDLPFAVAAFAGNDPEQGRFAGPVAANEADALPRFELVRDVAQQPTAADFDSDVV
jgi:hypothetical protein